MPKVAGMLDEFTKFKIDVVKKMGIKEEGMVDFKEKDQGSDALKYKVETLESEMEYFKVMFNSSKLNQIDQNTQKIDNIRQDIQMLEMEKVEYAHKNDIDDITNQLGNYAKMT